MWEKQPRAGVARPRRAFSGGFFVIDTCLSTRAGTADAPRHAVRRVRGKISPSIFTPSCRVRDCRRRSAPIIEELGRILPHSQRLTVILVTPSLRPNCSWVRRRASRRLMMNPGVIVCCDANMARSRSRARTAGGSNSGCPDRPGRSHAARNEMASIPLSPNDTTYGRSMPGFHAKWILLAILVLPGERNKLRRAILSFQIVTSPPRARRWRGRTSPCAGHRHQ